MASFWEICEYVAEGVVILGAIGEFVADFTIWIRPRRRKRLVERAAGVVLIAGLAFEVLATAKANDENGKQIATLNQQSANAWSTANVAAAQAGALGVKVDTLPSFVAAKEAQLTALAAQMKRSSADLDRVRLVAQASQASAQTALATFRREAAPRTLAPDQRRRLITALRGRITLPVIVESEPGDVEAYPYAQEFLSVLTEAGIKAKWQPFPSISMWFNEPGVYVWPTGKSSEAPGAILLKALKSVGIDADHAESPKDMTEPSAPSLALIIWHKRPPTTG